MKRFALAVALLYFFALTALTVPFSSAAFGIKFHDTAQAYVAWPYWVWILVMVASQFALLTIPVRVASRRPITRGSLVWPLLASGLMMGAMVAGALCSIYEGLFQLKGNGNWILWISLISGVITWCIWSVVFYRTSRPEEASDMISRQCRLLLKGSALELLIAVPTHIVARHRGYCCAGALTFIGLTMGASVMLFSYGPAVFFLFAERWKKLHPQCQRPPAEPEA